MGLSHPFAPHRDRRAAERTPTALRAKVFPGGHDCIIADFTRRGAKLRFAGPPPASDGPLVVVVWSSGLAFEVERRWTRGAETGVQFTASRDLRRPAPAHLAEIQALWLNRRPRLPRRQIARQAPIIDAKARPDRPGWMRPRATPPA